MRTEREEKQSTQFDTLMNTGSHFRETCKPCSHTVRWPHYIISCYQLVSQSCERCYDCGLYQLMHTVEQKCIR